MILWWRYTTHTHTVCDRADAIFVQKNILCTVCTVGITKYISMYILYIRTTYYVFFYFVPFDIIIKCIALPGCQFFWDVVVRVSHSISQSIVRVNKCATLIFVHHRYHRCSCFHCYVTFGFIVNFHNEQTDEIASIFPPKSNPIQCHI